MVDAYLDKTTLTQTERDIAGNFKSLLQEMNIQLLNLTLLGGFFCGYLFHHLKWLQGIDPHIGTPSYLQFHILPWIFLMLRDLDELDDFEKKIVLR